jgi:hypothetical protein
VDEAPGAARTNRLNHPRLRPYQIEANQAIERAISEHVRLMLVAMETTTQASLAKAFRGELVPTEAELARQQDRDYEPATALLERIRVERNSQSEIGSPTRGSTRAKAKPPTKRKKTD